MPFEIAGWCLLEAKFGPVCNRRADTEQTPSRHRAEPFYGRILDSD
jgi:hypothetical protein